MLGLITEDEEKKVTYGDGTTGMAWVGIHLRAEFFEKLIPSGIPYEKGEYQRTEVKIGDKWSSRSPRVVGHIEDLELTLRTMVAVKALEMKS